jgi:hypothetical protein
MQNTTSVPPPGLPQIRQQNLDAYAKSTCRIWGRRVGVEKMGKGVTLSREELIALRELLNSMEL